MYDNKYAQRPTNDIQPEVRMRDQNVPFTWYPLDQSLNK